eukprot:TRINITY_DN106_c0_g1_i1.p1 TRINITY_DN106_c0_g1~~TRINITY_DN106_c0_g1_i1.p1  ORF type:complete len:1794 (+),score=524.00 TRINITY_DN106_c0_g1_i1:33-5384(+)
MSDSSKPFISVLGTGNKIDQICHSLVESAKETDENVLNQIIASLVSIGNIHPELVLSTSFNQINSCSLSIEHKVALFKVATELLETISVKINSNLGKNIIVTLCYELTESQSIQSDLQEPCANCLAAFSLMYPTEVMNNILSLVQPGEIPPFFLVYAIGNFAETNGEFFVTRANEVFARLNPVLGSLKQDNYRWVFARCLRQIAEALVQHSKNAESYASELLSIFDVLSSSYWLLSKTASVSFMSAEALSFILQCINASEIERVLVSFCKDLLSLIRKAKSLSHKLCLVSALVRLCEASITCAVTSFVMVLNDILACTFDYVMQPLFPLLEDPKGQDINGIMRLLNETHRLTETIANGHLDSVIDFLLNKLRDSNETIRCSALILLNTLIGTCDSILQGRKATLVGVIRSLTKDPKNSQLVIKYIVQIIGKLGAYDYLNFEGSYDLIFFLVECISVDPNTLQLAEKSLALATQMQAKTIFDNFGNAIEETKHVLYPNCLKTFRHRKLLNSISFQSKVLSGILKYYLQNEKNEMEENEELIRIPFDTDKDLPSPGMLLAELLVLACDPQFFNDDFGDSDLNKAAKGLLLFLAMLAPVMHDGLESCLTPKIAELVGYLKSAGISNNCEYEPNLKFDLALKKGLLVDEDYIDFESTDQQGNMSLVQWQQRILLGISDVLIELADEAFCKEIAEGCFELIEKVANTSFQRTLCLQLLGICINNITSTEFVRNSLSKCWNILNFKFDMDRQAFSIFVGLSARKHFDICVDFTLELFKDDSMYQQRKSSGFFGKANNIYKTEQFDAAFRSFGQICTHSNPVILVNRVPTSILNGITPILFDLSVQLNVDSYFSVQTTVNNEGPKNVKKIQQKIAPVDSTMLLAIFISLQELSDSLNPLRLQKHKVSMLSLKGRLPLLDFILEYMSITKDDQIREQALKTINSLSRLPPCLTNQNMIILIEFLFNTLVTTEESELLEKFQSYIVESFMIYLEQQSPIVAFTEILEMILVFSMRNTGVDLQVRVVPIVYEVFKHFIEILSQLPNSMAKLSGFPQLSILLTFAMRFFFGAIDNTIGDEKYSIEAQKTAIEIVRMTLQLQIKLSQQQKEQNQEDVEQKQEQEDIQKQNKKKLLKRIDSIINGLNIPDKNVTIVPELFYHSEELYKDTIDLVNNHDYASNLRQLGKVFVLILNEAELKRTTFSLIKSMSFETLLDNENICLLNAHHMCILLTSILIYSGEMLLPYLKQIIDEFLKVLNEIFEKFPNNTLFAKIIISPIIAWSYVGENEIIPQDMNHLKKSGPIRTIIMEYLFSVRELPFTKGFNYLFKEITESKGFGRIFIKFLLNSLNHSGQFSTQTLNKNNNTTVKIAFEPSVRLTRILFNSLTLHDSMNYLDVIKGESLWFDIVAVLFMRIGCIMEIEQETKISNETVSKELELNRIGECLNSLLEKEIDISCDLVNIITESLDYLFITQNKENTLQLYDSLAEYLNSSYNGQRLATIITFSQLIKRCDEHSDVLQSILGGSLSLISDQLADVRLHAVISVGNIAELPKQLIDPLALSIVTSVMATMDDEDLIVIETLEALSKIIFVANPLPLAPLIPNIAQNLKKLLEHENSDVRYGAIKAFEILTLFVTASNKNVIIQHIHNALCAIILLLNDPDNANMSSVVTKVMKSFVEVISDDEAVVNKLKSSIKNNSHSFSDLARSFSKRLVVFFPQNVNNYLMTIISFTKSKFVFFRSNCVLLAAFMLKTCDDDVLKTIAVDHVIGEIIRRLSDSNPSVRQSAADALGLLKGL